MPISCSGLPFQSTRLNPLIGRTKTDSELGIFVQDAFKVSKRLTLDLGLRWDHFGPSNYKDGLLYNWDPNTGNVIVPQSALDKVSPLYPVSTIKVVAGNAQESPSLHNFAPRIGFAWRPWDDKTVFRGSYGIFTETLGRFARDLSNGPFQISESFFNAIQNGAPLFAFPESFPGRRRNRRLSEHHRLPDSIPTMARSTSSISRWSVRSRTSASACPMSARGTAA